MSEPCPSINPETGHKCSMAEGHVGPHKIGDPYHPTERWAIKCLHDACEYHGNQDGEGKYWNECIHCGHIMEKCPEGTCNLVPRMFGKRVAYICVRCGHNAPDREKERPKMTVPPAVPGISSEESATIEKATGQLSEQPVELFLSHELSSHLLFLLGVASADPQLASQRKTTRELLVVAARAHEAATAPRTAPAIVQVTAPILDKFRNLDALLRTQKRHFDEMEVSVKALLHLLETLKKEREAQMTDSRVVTCVFCGHEYPPGTPAANHQLLREHVAVCPEHPAKVYRDLAAEALEKFHQLQRLAIFSAKPVGLDEFITNLEAALK